jgi:diaminohydroxyphosphoribosylaminopyrimidine deaminase / 5-amino-6-(5-phosphoribosylamino)uracil reductase
VPAAMRLLAARGITRVFSEGGPSCAEVLVAHDLVDEFALATSSSRLGEPGVPAIGPRLKVALGERFRRVAAEQLGPDRLELFERA